MLRPERCFWAPWSLMWRRIFFDSNRWVKTHVLGENECVLQWLMQCLLECCVAKCPHPGAGVLWGVPVSCCCLVQDCGLGPSSANRSSPASDGYRCAAHLDPCFSRRLLIKASIEKWIKIKSEVSWSVLEQVLLWNCWSERIPALSDTSMCLAGRHWVKESTAAPWERVCIFFNRKCFIVTQTQISFYEP